MVVLLWFRILKLILLPSPGCTPASEERRHSGAQGAPGHGPAGLVCTPCPCRRAGCTAPAPAQSTTRGGRKHCLCPRSEQVLGQCLGRFKHSTCTKAMCSQTLTAFHALCPADDIRGGGVGVRTCQPRFLKAFGVCLFKFSNCKCWALCFNVNSEQWPLGPVTKNQTCN